MLSSPPPLRHMRKYAFTLVEAIAVITLLGLFTVITLPKLLGNYRDAQNKALFKEAITTIYTPLHDLYINQIVTISTDLSPAVRDGILSVKYCPNHAVDGGCWSWGANLINTGADDFNSVILPNGVRIIGVTANGTVNTYSDLTARFVIDINGLDLPNQEGVDQIGLGFCFNRAGCSNPLWLAGFSTWYNGSKAGGNMFPLSSTSAILYDTIFNN
jgi:type II secretory pathway pseudopilin PulG